MIQIGLLGGNGRMGKQVSQLIHSEFASKLQLVESVDREDELEPLLDTDLVIDFSSPAAMLELTALATERAKKGSKLPAFVVGSTGWTQEQVQKLEFLASKTPLLMAPNFSVGVLILRKILANYSALLMKTGFSPVITEAHHRHKKDAPSGTAIALQESIAPGNPETIQTHSIRSGETVGDHEISFFGKGEKLQLGHFAQDRSIFARGAIEAGIWVEKRRANWMEPQLPLLGEQKQRILTLDDFFNDL